MNKDCFLIPCLECQRTQKRLITAGEHWEDNQYWIGCKYNKNTRFRKIGQKWIQQENVNGRWYIKITT
jgi:hypothetical protein